MRALVPTLGVHSIDHSRHGLVTAVNLVVEERREDGTVHLRAVNGQRISDFDNETLRLVADPEWKSPLEADVDMPDEATAIVTPRWAREGAEFPSFDECAEVIPFFDGTSTELPVTWRDLAKMMLEDRREDKRREEAELAERRSWFTARQARRASQDPDGESTIPNRAVLKLIGDAR